mmetsp:Transcript_4764/g.7380  ORF Transcript_4764/g.7380 Transcript_4764/m.7380 type:complete len:128 (+) Transcript_4764:2-385(+)
MIVLLLLLLVLLDHLSMSASMMMNKLLLMEQIIIIIITMNRPWRTEHSPLKVLFCRIVRLNPDQEVPQGIGVRLASELEQSQLHLNIVNYYFSLGEFPRDKSSGDTVWTSHRNKKATFHIWQTIKVN